MCVCNSEGNLPGVCPGVSRCPIVGDDSPERALAEKLEPLYSAIADAKAAIATAAADVGLKGPKPDLREWLRELASEIAYTALADEDPETVGLAVERAEEAANV